MSTLSVIVVGAGHLGRIHARLLAGGEYAQLAGIVDPDADAREALAAQHNTSSFESWEQVVERIDAAIIAAPTVHHAEIAIGLIEAGKHVLVEKPLAFSYAEATQICDAAERHEVIVQSGHCERFNPAFQSLRTHNPAPRLIQSERSGPYSFRSTDIGVVFDLMVHDIDLALSLVKAPLEDVQAVGGSVIGPHEDWAQATLAFANGAVAQLSACRTSIDATRLWKVQADGLYAELDFASGTLRTLTPGAALIAGFDPNALTIQQRQAWKPRLFEDLLMRRETQGEGNAILEEQIDFVEAAQQHCQPQAAGRSAAEAVRVAELVLERIRRPGDQRQFRKAG